MTPKIPITDPRFVYRKAIDTDVRETWERAKEEQQEQAKKEKERK